MGLCCGQADQFRASKGKGCCDKNVAKPFESVVERSRIDPVLTPNVASILTSATVDHHAKNSAVFRQYLYLCVSGFAELT